MSLRDLVTGSDACTPDDGAGPSNAFAGLANNLLGSSSKDQERLREVRRVALRSSPHLATLLCCWHKLCCLPHNLQPLDCTLGSS